MSAIHDTTGPYLGLVIEDIVLSNREPTTLLHKASDANITLVFMEGMSLLIAVAVAIARPDLWYIAAILIAMSPVNLIVLKDFIYKCTIHELGVNFHTPLKTHEYLYTSITSATYTCSEKDTFSIKITTDDSTRTFLIDKLFNKKQKEEKMQRIALAIQNKAGLS